MISHQYKCIFIHIPKTAGTSIEQKLGHFKEIKRGVQDHRTISQIEPVLMSDLARSFLRKDTSMLILQIKKAIKDKRSNLKHCYNSYFKFSFVRNPWARVYSWYKNVMRDEHHKKRYSIENSCSFEYFLKNHLSQEELKPQLFWLIDKKGDVPLDFIGRFENLNQDFDFVAKKIGLENSELPKLLVGDGQHYTKHYNSEMVDTISKIYRNEIDFFNFKYGE